MTEDDFEPVALSESTQRILYEMPGVTPGSVPIPEQFESATKDADRAAQLYESGEYEEAAKLYLEIAEQLQSEDAYKNEFASIRGIAYQNAALCYLETGEVEAGRARLDGITDEAAAEGLARARSSLSPTD